MTGYIILIVIVGSSFTILDRCDNTVPYIVDTPFARIDKEHLSKILTQFFTKLNGQILILSTDEEIVGDYQSMVSDIISDTYVLKHTSDGSTQIIPDAYFGGENSYDQ